MAAEQGQKGPQSTGKQAPPLRRGLIRSLPSLPQPAGPQGITFSRFALCMGAAVVLASLGWAYFIGYTVGRGDNPREQVEEATSFLRPSHEAQDDKAAQSGQTAQQAAGNMTPGSMAQADAAQTGQSGQSAQLGHSGQIGQSSPSGQAGPQAMPAPQAAPVFDPHARPQGDSLAAWGNQTQAAAPAAASAQKATAQQGRVQDAGKPQPAPAKAQTPPAPKGPKYAFTYQMGAFKSKPAAEALQKQLAAKGRKGTVSKSGSVFLVTFLVRGTEDEARAARQALERQGLGKALLISRRPL